MRTALVLTSLLFVAPAAAENVVPDVTSVTGPLSLRGAFHSWSPQRCSRWIGQSFQQAVFQLDVAADGLATLTVEHQTRSATWSRGRRVGRGGQPDRRTHTDAERVIRRGYVTRSGQSSNGLIMTFTSAERRSGEGVSGSPTTPEVAILRCWMAREGVSPAAGSRRGGDVPTPRSVLECAFDTPPRSFAELHEPPPIVLGHGAGFVVHVHGPLASRTRTIRLAE